MTRWHDDTSFSTFRLARGQAGTFGLIFPACPRESKSSEITVISVTLSPEAGYFRIKTQRLMVQKSVTYDAKVRDLRPVIHWLTNRITSIKPLKIKQARHLEVIPSKAWKRAYEHQNKENLWESMSNHEQVWATMNCPLTVFVSLQRSSEILGAPNQQAIVRRSHHQAVPRRSHPAQHGEDLWWNGTSISKQ